MYEVLAGIIFVALCWALWKNYVVEKEIRRLQEKVYRMDDLTTHCPKCGSSGSIEYYDCWKSFQCKRCEFWWEKPIEFAMEEE